MSENENREETHKEVTTKMEYDPYTADKEELIAIRDKSMKELHERELKLENLTHRIGSDIIGLTMSLVSRDGSQFKVDEKELSNLRELIDAYNTVIDFLKKIEYYDSL